MHEGHKKFIHYFVCIILIRGMLEVLCRRDDNIKTSVDEAQCDNELWKLFACMKGIRNSSIISFV